MIEFLSIITLITNVLTAIVLVAFFALPKVRTLVSSSALTTMLIAALAATLGSLYLSDIQGWTPCKMCWLQRIFMYPQVVLLAIALWVKDRTIVRYILALSLIGIALALYHYYLQIEATFFPEPVDPTVPCDASGESCARTYTFRFGYITIPMMAASAFLYNILVSLHVIRTQR